MFWEDDVVPFSLSFGFVAYIPLQMSIELRASTEGTCVAVRARDAKAATTGRFAIAGCF